MKKEYDFIFCGYGLSSSVILYKMSKINYYLGKKLSEYLQQLNLSSSHIKALFLYQDSKTDF